MEARSCRVDFALALLAEIVVIALNSTVAYAAGYRTTNFTVSAPTPELAKEIGDSAEAWRAQLAREWLGKELPPWSKACPIHAQVSPKLGAGGATSFVFDRGEVFGWKMTIQGSRERILDSVLPHEVTHTIFASYFRQPLPRWADEGACTTVEHPSEIAKQERMLIVFLKTGRGIPFGQMFQMKEYPPDVMPLYSQGHSLAQWLIEARGRTAFLEFLSDGMQDENWERAIHAHYGFENFYAMQTSWLDWVKQGRPRVGPGAPPVTQVAAGEAPAQPQTPATTAAIYRGQSPDALPAAGPVAQGRMPVTPASHRASSSSDAGASVYAVAADNAQRQRAASQSTSASAISARSTSVYDASANTGVIRR